MITHRSLYYLHRLKLDFLSCDPFKVPLARLILAQACVDEYATTKTYELDPSLAKPIDEEPNVNMELDDWTVFF